MRGLIVCGRFEDGSGVERGTPLAAKAVGDLVIDGAWSQRPFPCFSVRRVCIVADRGMISAETIAELETRGLLYILGVRERTDTLARELVLDDPAPFIPLVLTKRAKDIEYEAKAVVLAGRRYIVCRNREEMRKDAAARAAIPAAPGSGSGVGELPHGGRESDALGA